MQDVVGQRDDHDIPADYAGHQDGVRYAERQDHWLAAQVTEPFLHVGRINRQRSSGLRDFGIFPAYQRLRRRVRGFGIFARVLAVITRRYIAAAHAIEAIGGDEVREPIDQQNSCDAHVVVEKSDEGAGEEHTALYADEHGSVRAGDLARRHHFLYQRVYVGPVNRGAGSGEQRHRVEMPDVQVSAPGDVGGGQHRKAAREIEQHAEVAAIHAVNQYTAKKRNDEAGERYDDDLPTPRYRRVRGRHDVPAHADEIHPAAKQRNEHRREKIADPALLPQQRPVNSVCDSGGHRAYQFTISRRLVTQQR